MEFSWLAETLSLEEERSPWRVEAIQRPNPPNVAIIRAEIE